ncbi:hypothetical protein F8388_000928 [Cannabis sativa]|uniref:non-specific serine/threonine protein kinase n=1 Tax=Cannabis sativa TaxID=3483 RepID=A0A7J6FPY1_CANSA|nr:hypothetical protein F8388_000928 [Cannabis sativa]
MKYYDILFSFKWSFQQSHTNPLISPTPPSSPPLENGLSLHNFKILKEIGAGIGKVYLCKLNNNSGASCYCAMKVVDKKMLAVKGKVNRAEMEEKIMKMLDHPFLSSLYAEFEDQHFSYIVMEYCSGGDLNYLRHQHRRKQFSLNSARFYAGEVLLALEYLHMLGIIYRDLKPKNVLVKFPYMKYYDILFSFKWSFQQSHTNPLISPTPPSSPPLENGLSLHNFKILKEIGAGIGKVYLCKLNNNSGASCYCAMKVVDKKMLAVKGKVNRAEMEEKIMKMLDHPFLSSLYAEFEDQHFSYIVMEYCSGGDLNYLRHQHPRKQFSLNSARFYAGEVLLALEYLHMLGIIYRDLKPKNVLVKFPYMKYYDILFSFKWSFQQSHTNPLISPTPPSSPPLKNGLSLHNFKILKEIGAGIGKVYLCKLNNNSGASCYCAMKVVDKKMLAVKGKVNRAEMEEKIMKMLDHPFLSSLYAEFEDQHFSYIVMEYCSGGDLNYLRHQHPRKQFSLNSARFYAGEVLLALEYLHMLGIIYRDLKPKNVLVKFPYMKYYDILFSFKWSFQQSHTNPLISPTPPSSPPLENGLSLHNFKILKEIGAGIGKVYLCKLNNNSGASCYCAMKVVDKKMLAVKGKVNRAEMEEKIMKMLDHPFLSSLYAEFEDQHFSYIVMEYCSGGDLNYLRHQHPRKQFSLNSARFYAGEVLLALEYLHMLGIIYRDLKPKNVLVKSNAESVTARSLSVVGTHEYVSPEMAKDEPHGNTVDWWAYGVFIYEMIYGRTLFVAQSRKRIISNIVNMSLAFPAGTMLCELELHARELITALLVKDPIKRLGAKYGATEVKKHPFFKGLSFALIRSSPLLWHIAGLRRQKTNGMSCTRQPTFDYF